MSNDNNGNNNKIRRKKVSSSANKSTTSKSANSNSPRTKSSKKKSSKKKDKFKFVLSNQAYTAFAIAVIYSIGGFTNLLSMLAFLVIVFLYRVPVVITLII